MRQVRSHTLLQQRASRLPNSDNCEQPFCPLCLILGGVVVASGPSNAEIAALLHIDLPKKGPKSFWQLAQTLPECGVGKKFYRKVRLRVA